MKCKLKTSWIKCSNNRLNLKPTKLSSKTSSTCRWRKFLKLALMQDKAWTHLYMFQRFYHSLVKRATMIVAQKNPMYQQRVQEDLSGRTPSKAKHLMTSNRRLFTMNNSLKSWNLHQRHMERLLLDDSSSSMGKCLNKHSHQALVQKVPPRASLTSSK